MRIQGTLLGLAIALSAAGLAAADPAGDTVGLADRVANYQWQHAKDTASAAGPALAAAQGAVGGLGEAAGQLARDPVGAAGTETAQAQRLAGAEAQAATDAANGALAAPLATVDAATAGALGTAWQAANGAAGTALATAGGAQATVNGAVASLGPTAYAWNKLLIRMYENAKGMAP